MTNDNLTVKLWWNKASNGNTIKSVRRITTEGVTAETFNKMTIIFQLTLLKVSRTASAKQYSADWEFCLNTIFKHVCNEISTFLQLPNIVYAMFCLFKFPRLALNVAISLTLFKSFGVENKNAQSIHWFLS